MWRQDPLGLNGKVKNLIVDSTIMLPRRYYAPSNTRQLKSVFYPFTFLLVLTLLMLSSTFNKLKSGILPHGASLLPRFLFPENQVYNREDVEDGCFKGHLLLRASLFIYSCVIISQRAFGQVAKHVLQGPSAALQAPGFHRGRQGNAVLINLTSVTRPLLAYLGIQASTCYVDSFRNH